MASKHKAREFLLRRAANFFKYPYDWTQQAGWYTLLVREDV